MPKRRAEESISQSGHRNLCYLNQTLRLWSLASAVKPAFSDSRLSFPLTLTEYCFPEQDFLRVHFLQEHGERYDKKEDEIVMKCQLSVYLPQTSFEWVFKYSINRIRAIQDDSQTVSRMLYTYTYNTAHGITYVNLTRTFSSQRFYVVSAPCILRVFCIFYMYISCMRIWLTANLEDKCVLVVTLASCCFAVIEWLIASSHHSESVYSLISIVCLITYSSCIDACNSLCFETHLRRIITFLKHIRTKSIINHLYT